MAETKLIEIELSNAEQIARTLEKLSRAVKDRTPLMKSIAGTMEAGVLQNFNDGGRPPWQGLKYREGDPLVNTRSLMKSITSEYDNNQAMVGTGKPYAAIHQVGGKAGRNKKVEIPARPFLLLTPEEEEDILEDIQDYFQKIIL